MIAMHRSSLNWILFVFCLVKIVQDYHVATTLLLKYYNVFGYKNFATTLLKKSCVAV